MVGVLGQARCLNLVIFTGVVVSYIGLSVNVQTLGTSLLELPERHHGVVPRVHGLARVVLQVPLHYEIVACRHHIARIIQHFHVLRNK